MKTHFLSNQVSIKFAAMASMRRLVLWMICVLGCALIVAAQGQGIVDGRLVNGTNAATVPAGATLEVMSLMGGMTVLKTATADAAGKFHIEGLPADTPLLIRAAYRAVPYYGTAKFDSSGKAAVEIQVFEPTASMQGIRVQSAQIAFKLTGAGLSAIESFSFDNETRPPRSYMSEDGNFRFSKAPGIIEPPALGITAPGSNMPVTQAPLESADGQSYYSLYPLRPGTTTFEVFEALPYQNGSYTFRKKFFQDIDTVKIGVIPQDMKVSGDGLARVPAAGDQNFAVYSTGPIKAGAEVVWTFSGGIPLPEAPQPPANTEEPPRASVHSSPTIVGQNALVIGVPLLMGLVLILWYAAVRVIPAAGAEQDAARMRELKERRQQLLNYVASLDAQHDSSQGHGRRDYERLREQGKRHLRRVEMLLGRSQESGVRSQNKSRLPLGT